MAKKASDDQTEPTGEDQPDANLNADLCRAVASDDRKAMRELLKQGADPNTLCRETGRPVLFSTGRLSAIKILVEAGAEPNVISEGENVGHYVSRRTYNSELVPLMDVLFSAGLDVNARPIVQGRGEIKCCAT